MPTTPDLVAFLREHRGELKIVARDGRFDVELDGGEVLLGVDIAVLREAFDDVEQAERINQ